MKTLILIRHAKSGYAENLQNDFERTLNQTGHAEAAEMSKRLFDKKIKVEAFISSPAKRALTTCKYFVEAFGKKTGEIIKMPKLYEANISGYFEVIKDLKDNYNSIAIFGHNPTITAFANELLNLKINDIPTAGIFGISAEIPAWQDFQQSKKEFLFFDFPKN